MTQSQIQDEMREAFERDFANYKKDWSDDGCPLLPEEIDAYKAGYETAWQGAVLYRSALKANT